MTPDEIARIRERADKATPGPWRYDAHGYIEGPVEGPDGIDIASLPGYDPQVYRQDEIRANGAFLAASRADIPALLDEVERLTVGRQSVC
jgi:hypothetical protein